MLRYLSKIFLAIGVLVIILVVATITTVDRTPYKETSFYEEMNTRLDSLSEHWTLQSDTSGLRIGWSEVNITPEQAKPLAGYGARDPKTMDGVLDSSFIRTVVFELGEWRLAMVFADLLIIHPELRERVFQSLSDSWDSNEIYFTATHTHSGQGGWAPGPVGELFAGDYEEDQLQRLT